MDVTDVSSNCKNYFSNHRRLNTNPNGQTIVLCLSNSL